MLDATQHLLDGIGEFGLQLEKQMDDFLKDLHTDQVDDVFIAHDDLLRNVYRLFSGRRALPGQSNFMSMIEFESLLDTIEAYDDVFTLRKMAFAFRMGMITRPDETEDSRFQEMSFMEFQHAVGAVVFLRAGYAPHLMVKLLDEFISVHVKRAKNGPKDKEGCAKKGGASKEESPGRKAQK